MPLTVNAPSCVQIDQFTNHEHQKTDKTNLFATHLKR